MTNKTGNRHEDVIGMVMAEISNVAGMGVAIIGQ